MLQRFSQVGEFYVMAKPDGVKIGSKGFMDIVIFDEESDRHVKITYEQALESTGLFEFDGTGNAPGWIVKNGVDPAKNIYVDPSGDAAKSVTIGAFAAAATELSKQNLEGAEAGLSSATDAPIVIARPFIEHAMLSAVLTVSGGDTGATIFGPSDMQASDDLSQTLVPDARLPSTAHTFCVFVSTDLGQHLRQDH